MWTHYTNIVIRNTNVPKKRFDAPVTIVLYVSLLSCYDWPVLSWLIGVVWSAVMVDAGTVVEMRGRMLQH